MQLAFSTASREEAGLCWRQSALSALSSFNLGHLKKVVLEDLYWFLAVVRQDCAQTPGGDLDLDTSFLIWVVEVPSFQQGWKWAGGGCKTSIWKRPLAQVHIRLKMASRTSHGTGIVGSRGCNVRLRLG